MALEKSKDNSVEPCSSEPMFNRNKHVKKDGIDVPTCPDVTNECEAGVVDVDYIDSDTSVSTLLARLVSKDWVKTCEALNNVCQLAIYHKQRSQELLQPLVLLSVKSVKNLTSFVCRTALMTCVNIFQAYGEQMTDSVDLLLMPQFLKSSKDKHIVCEATEATPIPKMQPYLKYMNPQIRVKTYVCISKSVPCLGLEGIDGMDKLNISISPSTLSNASPDGIPNSFEIMKIVFVVVQLC